MNKPKKELTKEPTSGCREREKAAYQLGMREGYKDGNLDKSDALRYVINKINTPFVSRAHVLDLCVEASVLSQVEGERV